MKWTIDGKKVVFQGELNEHVDLEALKSSLGAGNENLEFDFSQVAYANSVGISSWLKFLQDYNGRFEYVNVPYWMVSYFNLIPELIAGKFKVTSIQVPYYAENSKDDITVSFVIGKELPILDSYKDYELSSLEKNGDTYIPDIVPEIYFGFISANKNLYA